MEHLAAAIDVSTAGCESATTLDSDGMVSLSYYGLD